MYDGITTPDKQETLFEYYLQTLDERITEAIENLVINTEVYQEKQLQDTPYSECIRFLPDSEVNRLFDEIHKRRIK